MQLIDNDDIESFEVVSLEDVDLSFLDHPQAVYSKETKIKAVSLYFETGSFKKTSESLGVSVALVKHWKEKSPWWNEIWVNLRKQKQFELEALLTNTIHTALGNLDDRLTNGDYKLDTKTGELRRIPVGAKDLAVTLAIIYDKRALIRGEATSIKQDSSTTLQSLENKFKDFALQLKEKDVIAKQ